MSITQRVLNFSSGPAVLPVPVLEQVQRDLIALPGVGMSVMEISHRSATFDQIIKKAEADIRQLASVPDTYRILFLQGGASLQFSMVPLNLLGEGQTADYIITGSWGLGETVVQGRVKPDEFWVHKPTLRAGFRPILRREIATKSVKLIYAEGGTRPVREVRVPVADRRRAILEDGEILTLATWALAIEDHYSGQAGRPTPMDIEWARDGRTGELFILQARPETVHSQVVAPSLELWRRRGEGRVLLTGRSATTPSGTAIPRPTRTAPARVTGRRVSVRRTGATAGAQSTPGSNPATAVTGALAPAIGRRASKVSPS